MLECPSLNRLISKNDFTFGFKRDFMFDFENDFIIDFKKWKKDIGHSIYKIHIKLYITNVYFTD